MSEKYRYRIHKQTYRWFWVGILIVILILNVVGQVIKDGSNTKYELSNK